MTKDKKTELLQGGIPCSAMGDSDPEAPRELQGCTNMATRFVGDHPWCDDCGPGSRPQMTSAQQKEALELFCFFADGCRCSRGRDEERLGSKCYECRARDLLVALGYGQDRNGNWHQVPKELHSKKCLDLTEARRTKTRPITG